MDHDHEIHSLAAQTLAMEAIVSSVLHSVAKLDPRLAHAISQGFDEAANFVESRAIELGRNANPAHTVKAIQVVEQLRTAALGRYGLAR